MTSDFSSGELPNPETPEPSLAPVESAAAAAVESAPPAAVESAPPAAGGSLKALLREIVETVLLTVIIYLAVNFATGRFRVEGDSMQPNIHPNEYVLVDRISYRLGEPQRGDIVVFNYPLATERDFIKRIIGLPGETVSIRGGQVLVNGQALNEPYINASPLYENTWTLGDKQYFVLGDNRNASSDSHSWGPLDRRYLIGRAVVIYWPPEEWSVVTHHNYAQ